MIDQTRRRFLGAGLAFVAAPMIVRATSLMPIRSIARFPGWTYYESKIPWSVAEYEILEQYVSRFWSADWLVTVSKGTNVVIA
jgi:hypothetical protein